MDEIDRRLLTMLRHDGRRSLSLLAKDLAVTRATVRARLARLGELGTTDLPAFDAVLRKIRLIPGITLSETSLLLATPRSTKARG